MAMSSHVLLLSILLVAGRDVGVGEHTANPPLGLSGFHRQGSLIAQGNEVPVASMYSSEAMGVSAPVPPRGIVKVVADANSPSSTSPLAIVAR